MSLSFLWTGAAACLVTSAVPADDRRVDFARDVRPILSDNCYFCHGFDHNARKAGLRLDVREEAFAELRSGARAIVPGDADGSALLQRVGAADPDDRMPPAESGKRLGPAEIETLRRWIEQGAEWREHWSFVTPERPPAPAVSRADWPANDVDRFVLARLAEAGLEPSPPAAPETLLRRVTLDLTGLPPSPEELDAFLADSRPDAYERAVDRLLASPRYGEHMARYWLDAARYADTHGLHLDNERSMWRYREWVVRAFDENMPFDRFTVEQLAGDLLPEPTRDQLVASGFNRCNPTSAEGGMIDAEYLALYARDRVDTTATVWMGLTLACAKCHEHKYDPFSQREYYELYAFFNNLAEEASDKNVANPVPFLPVPDDEQRKGLEDLRATMAALAAEVDAPMPPVDAAQAEWETAQAELFADRWRILVPEGASAAHGTTLAILRDDSVAASGENPPREVFEVRAFAAEGAITALRLEALLPEGGAQGLPGRAPNENFVLSGFEVEAHPPGRPGEAVAVPFAGAAATHSQDGFPVDAALDGDAETGWAGLGAEGARSAVFVAREPFGFAGGTELVVRLRHESRFAQHALARLRLAVSEDPALTLAALGPWSRLGPLVESDGRAALEAEHGPERGVDLAAPYGPEELRWTEEPGYADGAVHAFDPVVGAVFLHRTIDSPTRRTMRVGLGSDDGLRVWLDGELVHENPAARAAALDQDLVDLELRAGRNELLLKVANYGGDFAFAFRRVAEDAVGVPMDVALALATPEGARSDHELRRVREHFRRNHSPEWRALDERLTALREEADALEAALPTTLISRERDERRPAHVLLRGQYDAPGERVEPGVPAVLPPLPAGAPRDRLGLARWLVAPEHPLTARVTVNRLWQQLFGTGLVKTAEDFGAQGEFPSHPELLDWLARELVDGGWDVKALLRTLVTSSTYRQSSRVTPELLAADPYDRLLARGPRFRLDAEVIRDGALFLGGILVERFGGPSVRPYQPPGVWEAVGYTSSNTAVFRRDDGDALYRRSLYTFWKRTAPPPNMVVFDAPSREACTVRRARTNTPLQALVLLNDPQFVEAARAFAARALREGGDSDAERAAWAFRAATAREPSPAETAVLLEVLAAERAAYRAAPDDAEALLAVGERPREEGLDAVEHAAWTNVATLILNLDETVTRG